MKYDTIWKIITIGKNPRDKFSQKLKDNGMKVSPCSDYMMKQDAFVVASEEEQIYLVNVSVGELGFDSATGYDAICARAKKSGLELFPPEVGPQLRLQFLDQSLDQSIFIAMEAVRFPNGDLDIFCMSRHSGGSRIPWLISENVSPGTYFHPSSRFVFRKLACLAGKQLSDT